MVTKIKIWGISVGVLLWNKDSGHGVFEFDSEFERHNWDISPIKMPLTLLRNGQRIFSFRGLPYNTFKGLPGLLADSLPDNFGNSIIDAWLASEGRNPDSFSPADRLCYIGSRGMGAMEFEPMLSESKIKSDPLELSALVKLANEILKQREEIKTNLRAKRTTSLNEIIQIGTSAGGARAKAIIALNEKTGEVRSGQVAAPKGFSHWILKFDGVNNTALGASKGYGRIEYAYFLMAKDCGIEMSECRLLEEGGRAHFITKRFDRLGANKRLHMQTLCGLAHYDYNDANTYSYEQAFQVMRQLRLSYQNAEQLFTRMVFNVKAFNNDDHTKNISFLMNEAGEWRLSPAYDVTFSHNPDNIWLKRHQMSVNGKREQITNVEILKVAHEMNIRKPQIIIDQIVSVLLNWKKYAAQGGVTKEQISAIAKLISIK